MSIVALPPQAVHAIGSAQVLTDSTSLVKELIDNALDAQATSITIELSANVLDVIQVKDNGHGIAPNDRALVGRRHCTSKIKDLNELANIGGASLGFRGEALASAVEMSGSFVVTTRIIGEATAVSLKVSRNGEVENEGRVSQAVGTTIRVTDFLRTFPVRRQTALKDSTKQLAKLKQTLQAYAFARPAVRLILKVLKAKNDKGNWTYAPKSDASVSDAATKILGKKVSDQCQWVVWSPDERSSGVGTSASKETEQSVEPDRTFGVETLIPKSDSDLSVICNVGHFISVDSRPVSCTRGTLKQVIQLFKSYLKSSSTTSAHQKIVDPFLCMNIICPRGSYDANVEPAKDDVLFSNASRIIGMVETFFKSHYGELNAVEKQTTSSRHGASKPRVFDLLLARKAAPEITKTALPEPVHTEPLASVSAKQIEEVESSGGLPEQTSPDIQGQRNGHKPNGPNSPGHSHQDDGSQQDSSSSQEVQHGTKQKWYNSMYVEEDGEDLVENDLTAQSQDPEDEDDLRDINATNPWTLAKTNTSIRRPKQIPTDHTCNPQLLTPAKDNSDLAQDQSSPLRRSVPILLTPAKSQDATSNEKSSPYIFPYPRRAWGKAHREADTSSQGSISEEVETSPSGALDSWVQRAPPLPGAADQDLFVAEQDSTSPLRPPCSDFVSASTISQGTPLSAIPDISQKPRRKPQQRAISNNINKPFTPPVRDLTRVWFDNLEPSSQRPKKPCRSDDAHVADIPIGPSQSSPHSPSPATPMHPGLALTMDYEKRKADAMAARRAFLRQQSQSQAQRLPSENPPLSISSSPPPSIKVSASQSSICSPHLNRYRSARDALHTSPIPSTSMGESPQDNSIPKINPKDPRAYLMRHAKDRTKRAKTSLLPLETSFSGGDQQGGVRDLVQVMKTEGFVEKIELGLRGMEMKEKTGFENLEEGEIESWEGRVRTLVERIHTGEGGDAEVEIFVRAALTEREE